MSDKSDQTPSVFISYSWDGQPHKDWVRRLAEDLVRAGVGVTLDQWDLHPGDDLAQFMAAGLKSARYVLLICTPTYAAKFDNRTGGVSHEAELILGEMLTAPAVRGRLIPLLRAGEPSVSIPQYLKTRLLIDFRSDEQYDVALDQLRRRLRNDPIYVRPDPAAAPAAASAPAAAPGGWVLVAGLGRERELTDKLRLTCEELGRMLADEGYGVVTGGWPGVDELVARSFARRLVSRGAALENFLTQVVVESEMPAYPAGNLILVSRGEEEWTEGVKRADAIVLVGGIGGTWTTGEYGLRYGKAVLPLADTGGDASKFYMHMLRAWEQNFFPAVNLDRATFQRVAREAPGVVNELAAILKLLRPAA